MTSGRLVVDGLRVTLGSAGPAIVDDIDFEIGAGEILGLVGESGSGKTTVGTALLGYARSGATITGGSVRIDGTDVLALSPRELRAQRGRLISYVPQDPGSFLNPALRINTQLTELLEVHEPDLPAGDVSARIASALDDVKLEHDEDLLKRYPHQLSGGQQQRICLAMAFLLRPRALVLDEPTTGLDVTTQEHVLATVRRLCKEQGVAALYVAHDLAVVANVADRVLVMYAGRIMESGGSATLFARPAHPYSQCLLAAVPNIAERTALVGLPGSAPPPGSRPQGCEFAPRCPVRLEVCSSIPPIVDLGGEHRARCHRAAEGVVAADVARPDRRPLIARGDPAPLSVKGLNGFYGGRQVLHDVAFDLLANECLALVGESGSGKTTTARALVGLLRERTGDIHFRGEPLADRVSRRSTDQRREIQYIFQNPYGSLNPRKTVGQAIAAPMAHFWGIRGREANRRAADALARVALPASALAKYPDQLSGGERQRVAIARALVCEPVVLICDEITSALDVSVQATVVEVLEELKATQDLSMVFVTHNLALVRNIADRVIVMRDGRIVETAQTEAALTAPRDAYTRQLIASTPSLSLMTAPALAPSIK